MTCVLHHIHLFWDEISLLSIHPLPRFSYPHARLLLTNALSYVNMQYLPHMTFVSFPIAHSPHPVNHLSYVSSVTFLLPEDDTPDVIPHHTMLRHTQYVSANRNFRPTPTHLRDLRPLPMSQPYALCPTSYPHTMRRSVAAPADTKAHVDSPIRAPSSYSLVSRETKEYRPLARSQLRERESSTCARADSLACSCVARALVSAALRPGAREAERIAGYVVPRRTSLLVCFT